MLWCVCARSSHLLNTILCAADQLTVIVNTFKRHDLLRAAIEQYSQCDVVKRIHINWAEDSTVPHSAMGTCCAKQLTFATPLATHNDSSLNTRFLPIPGAPFCCYT